MAHNRPAAPILALTPTERAYRQMSVVWGVLPALSDEIHSTDEMVEVANAKIIHMIKDTVDVQVGDRYVITAGVPFWDARYDEPHPGGADQINLAPVGVVKLPLHRTARI